MSYFQHKMSWWEKTIMLSMVAVLLITALYCVNQYRNQSPLLAQTIQESARADQKAIREFVEGDETSYETSVLINETSYE